MKALIFRPKRYKRWASYDWVSLPNSGTAEKCLSILNLDIKLTRLCSSAVDAIVYCALLADLSWVVA